MARNALVPPTRPLRWCSPLPSTSCSSRSRFFWLLWQLGKRPHAIGWMTGVYLTLSGVGRFLVEFVRINPKLYFHHTMSNAQVAALASSFVGFALVLVAAVPQRPLDARRKGRAKTAPEPAPHLPEPASVSPYSASAQTAYQDTGSEYRPTSFFTGERWLTSFPCASTRAPRIMDRQSPRLPSPQTAKPHISSPPA